MLSTVSVVKFSIVLCAYKPFIRSTLLHCFSRNCFPVECRLQLLEVITASLLHPTLKESVIFPFSPLLKKPTQDKDQLSNYRPIFNLSFISKIIE